MNNFKYISENTIRYLSLHDCCCTRMYWDKSLLILEMEWMEVLASHPDNPFEKAHQSGTGRIVLKDAAIKSGELVIGDSRIPIDPLKEIKDFQILTFDEIIDNGKFQLSLFGDSVREPEAEFIEMKVDYSSSKVMFNELGEISWFESDDFCDSNH